MKTLTITLTALLFTILLNGQPPQAFKYQAVVRNNSGEILQNQTVGVRISIHDATAGGTIVYQETFSETTNDYGLVNLEIGNGTPTIGTFAGIDWGSNSKFLETQIDPNGGVAYVPIGTSELLAVPYALYANRSNDAAWEKSGNDIYYNDGNIGVGTTTPTNKLHAYGDEAGLRLQDDDDPASHFTITDIHPTQLLFQKTNNSGHCLIDIDPLTLDGSSISNIRFFRSTNTTGDKIVKFYQGNNTAATSAGIAVDGGNSWFQLHGGNFGIGTSTALTPLQVNTDTHFNPGNYSDRRKGSLLLTMEGYGTTGFGNYGPTLSFSGIHTGRRRASIAAIQTSSDSDQIGLAFFTHPGTSQPNDQVTQMMVIDHNGYVGIGTTDPASKLDVWGNVTIRSEATGNIVMELGTGLDYAEGFNVSDKNGITAGTILCIDTENPGRLVISKVANDKKVAGIVAGANGLGSGIRLGADQFDFDVALAGRVYCNVDATSEAIEIGDQLTTSSIPGFAMKVTDFENANGAILGKAMEKLEKGKKGQILVLVTLQ